MNTVDPRHNRRSYAARDYYEPNAGRTNLFLLTHALVSRIQLEKRDDGVRATGVRFMVDGASHTIRVNKEVIVCGGTINSPQILELSGIGAPAVLRRVGIETVVDNDAVGENLNDHTATALTLVRTWYDSTQKEC
jgi:choline dehydrogenase